MKVGCHCYDATDSGKIFMWFFTCIFNLYLWILSFDSFFSWVFISLIFYEKKRWIEFSLFQRQCRQKSIFKCICLHLGIKTCLVQITATHSIGLFELFTWILLAWNIGKSYESFPCKLFGYNTHRFKPTILLVVSLLWVVSNQLTILL